MSADQDKETTLAFVRQRIPQRIASRAAFEQRFRNLQLLKYNRPQSLVIKASPAAIQLTLLNNPRLDFTYPSSVAAVPSDVALTSYRTALVDAANQLDERSFDAFGNAFSRTLPRLYSLFEAYVVLVLRALVIDRPITHRACNRLFNRIRTTQPDTFATMARHNSAIGELVDARETDLAKADIIARKYETALDNAMQTVKVLYQLLKQESQQPSPAGNQPQVEQNVPQPQTTPPRLTPTIKIEPPLQTTVVEPEPSEDSSSPSSSSSSSTPPSPSRPLRSRPPSQRRSPEQRQQTPPREPTPARQMTPPRQPTQQQPVPTEPIEALGGDRLDD